MTENTTPRVPHSLCWAVAGAAAIRLSLLAAVLLVNGDTGAMWCKDSSSYVVAAEHLRTTGRFANDAGLELARTPGYPLFLIPGLLFGQVEIITSLLQIAVSCGTVVLVYATAKLMFARPAVAVVAAWLYALEPLSIVYSTVLLSETLFTFLLVLSIYLLTRFAKGDSTGVLCAAALSLTAATYVRPITYFLPILLGMALCLRTMSHTVTWRRAAAQAVLFAGIAFGLTGLWQVRNYTTTGYLGFSSITDRLVYHYQAAAVIARQTGKPLPEVQAELGMSEFVRRQASDDWKDDTERATAYREIGAKGRDIIKSAPLTYGAIHLRGCLQTFLSPGAGRCVSLFGGGADDDSASAATRHSPAIGLYVLLGASCAVYYLLSFAALIDRPRRIGFAAFLVLVVIAYLALVSGGPAANSRFRHPMMPLVSMTAAAGLVVLLDRFQRSRELHPQ